MILFLVAFVFIWTFCVLTGLFILATQRVEQRREKPPTWPVGTPWWRTYDER